MRFRIKVCILICIVQLLSACSGSDVPAPLVSGPNPYAGTDLSGAPNILLIVADDMGYSDVGAFGAEIDTPNINALALSGTTFTNFHTASSCAPTRAMLLSGVDNHLAGYGSMHFIAPNQRGRPGYEDRMNEQVVSVARLLGDAGYRTSMVGKWHLGSKPGQWPVDRGFQRSFAVLGGMDSHFGENVIPPVTYVSDGSEAEVPDDFFSTDYYTDRLIEFIGSADEDSPFFAYAAYSAPHWPLQAPDEYIEKYGDRYDEGWDVLRSARFKRMQQMGIIPAQALLPPRLDEVPAWDDLPVAERRNEARKMAVYAAMIDNMDVNIGRLVTHLKSIGEYDNTLIIFMSDNGPDAFDPWIREGLLFRLMTLGADNSYENLGRKGSWVAYGAPWAQVSSTPLKYYKSVVSEGGVRTPMIVSFPQRFESGVINSAFLSVMDITPTLLELAGIAHTGKRYRGREVHPPDGVSLIPVLDGKSASIHNDNEATGFELFGQRALVSGEWKIQSLRPPYGAGEWEMFNINQDPAESTDLASLEPERLHSMLDQYESYSRTKGVIDPPPDFVLMDGSLKEFFMLMRAML